MTRLLLQPGSFEGLGLVGVEADRHGAAIAQRPDQFGTIACHAGSIPAGAFGLNKPRTAWQRPAVPPGADQGFCAAILCDVAAPVSPNGWTASRVASESMNSTSNIETEVLVIGGGQAGLAMGHHLADRGLRFLIVDANPEVGHVWRSRWDSLRLFTSAEYNDLPGMQFPGSRGSYPGKDEIADFLAAYATEFDLPLRLGTQITSLTRQDDRYLARSEDATIWARQVVVATGPFHTPFTPAIARYLDPDLAQIHSADYRNADILPAGRTLVVGGANSGQQIALELSDSRPVEISVGEKLPTLPQRPLGRDIWWWLTAIRLPRIPVESRLGQRLSQRDVVIGGGIRELKRDGITIRPRVVGGSGRTVTFEDGSAADYEAIVWATGFKVDHSWIEIPEIKDERDQVRHRRGVTDSAGLYLLGMTWQHTRTSALLGWVGNDAAFLADEIQARYRALGAAETPAATAT
jgi:putative flavoprotein involved in K+ transport